MLRRLIPCLALAAATGCVPPTSEVCRNVILPEQRTIEVRDPAALPAVQVPPTEPPRTVAQPRPETPEWKLSLDDAIRITLENARVIRVLAGVTVSSTSETIFDPAIANTTIDQAQARFDPNLTHTSTWERINTPFAIFDPFDPTKTLITSSPVDEYQAQTGLTKTNVLGGQWGLNWLDNPMRFPGQVLPLNPTNPHNLTLSYTQPLLQGFGYDVNMAPVVIARINTEQSYFQYKDAVQEMVRGVIQAYWNLVAARTSAWASQIQVEQAAEAYNRAKARQEAQLADIRDVAQAKVTLSQFRAQKIAADATVLNDEGVLRNLMNLPPEDGRHIIPTSAPADQRLAPNWDALVQLAEQRRPDIVELKLIVEADRQRLIQAESQALPQLNATALYRWNGLSGEVPNGEHLSTVPGQYADWSISVNFSVPLGLRQGRALVRQQQLTIARDRANVEQGVHDAVAQLALTTRDLANFYEQYRSYKEYRAAAYENLQVQLAEFRVGRNIYLNVLQALNDWGNATTSEAQALLNYNVALATLERQTGTILETHGLVFYEERYRAAGPIPLPCGDRCYPEAEVPKGEPHRYPGTDKPSEENFDLQNPALRLHEQLEKLPPPK